jgi:hypothetical protein
VSLNALNGATRLMILQLACGTFTAISITEVVFVLPTYRRKSALCLQRPHAGCFGANVIQTNAQTLVTTAVLMTIGTNHSRAVFSFCGRKIDFALGCYVDPTTAGLKLTYQAFNCTH